jgi:energy-coupling factor transporter ATP-binding protein EcfA2
MNTPTLQLTRLRVEQLRQFRQPFELTDFSPGLNILAGPNEAGKSTLVRAIRAAFFERHRSTAVDDLQPWGDASAAPTIELDFLLGGERHQLVKRFLNKKRCSLQIGTRTLDGVDAEDHLAQRFGFAFAGKGASKPEHWGIPGLLWVEQGTGQELDVSHAREHLHDALQGQSGAAASALAATGGDALLDQLRLQRAELLTGTGKPRGALLDAQTRRDDHQARLRELDAQILAYRQQVDQLSLLRVQHQADETAQPWQAVRTQLQAAQQQQQALQASAQQLQADQQRLAQLARQRELLLSQLQHWDQQQHDLARREQALAQAQADAQAHALRVAGGRQQAEAAQARALAARDALRAARLATTRQQLGQQLAEAQAAVRRTAEALQRAEAEHQRLAALRAQLAGQTLSKPQVEHLRQLERSAREAALRSAAVATRLQFSLQAGASLSLRTEGQSQPLQGQGEQLLHGPATLQLPGDLGSLRISPGGEDLARLARSHADAEAALRTALQRSGLADLADAEARLATLTELQAQTAVAQKAAEIVAPRGLEPLRAEAAQALARVQATEQALAQLPAPAAAAALTADLAEAEEAAATQAEQAAVHAWQTAQQAQAAAQSQCEAALRERDAAQALLAQPERQQQLAQAQQQLLMLQAEHAALATRTEAAAAALREARPEIVAQDIQRLQHSEKHLLDAHAQRRTQLLLLENTLQQAGAQGLEEERDSLAGALDRAERRADELQRRADALALLCDKLDAKRQATLSRLQAPLLARLQHYLPLLLPGATLQMGEQLAPGLITRPAAGGASESGEVASLSFGAREQLGLISRFAYADLLQQAGRPTLLILDDALVHSDAQRLSQMKRVLFDAAQRHQVLLFTCHPEDWRDLGVPVRSLQR